MTDPSIRALLPDGWPRPVGYANGISARGRQIFVAGQVGWDSAGTFAEGLVPQVRQALTNVVAVLQAGGAEPRHLVRIDAGQQLGLLAPNDLEQPPLRPRGGK